MSFKIIDIASPELPYSIPLIDSFSSQDKLEISGNIKGNSSVKVMLKASEDKKTDPRIPLCLKLTVDGILCKSGTKKNWKKKESFDSLISEGDYVLKIAADTTEYSIEVNGKPCCTFPNTYKPCVSKFLDITVFDGEATVHSVTYSRQMKWIGSRIGSEAPKEALKCGNDDLDNSIYLGRGFKNNGFIIVSVNPAKKEANVAFNGRSYPMNDFDLLEDSNYYTWEAIGEDKKLPTNAVAIDENEEILVGRITIEGSVIPGSIYKDKGILCVPYNGKENKYSSCYEVLTILKPDDLTKKVAPKIPEETEEEKECIICYDADRTHILDCGHYKYCEKCADIILQTDKQCPYCRKAVTSALKVFF